MNTTELHGSSHLDGGGASIGGGGHCPAVRVRRVALRGRATGGAAVPVIFFWVLESGKMMIYPLVN